MCTRQSRKVIWDMIDTLFLTTVAVEPAFVPFRYTKLREVIANIGDNVTAEKYLVRVV